MPRHAWTVLCDRAIVDSQSNNVSLINVIEQVNVSETACKPLLDGEQEVVHLEHQHMLCGLWESEGEHDADGFNVRVEFRSPADAALGGSNIEVDFHGRPRSRVMFRSGAFPVVGEGRYHFVIEFRSSESEPWKEAARIPVDVHIAPDSNE